MLIYCHRTYFLQLNMFCKQKSFEKNVIFNYACLCFIASKTLPPDFTVKTYKWVLFSDTNACHIFYDFYIIFISGYFC